VVENGLFWRFAAQPSLAAFGDSGRITRYLGKSRCSRVTGQIWNDKGASVLEPSWLLVVQPVECSPAECR
jgi:hypothetical protein